MLIAEPKTERELKVDKLDLVEKRFQGIQIINDFGTREIRHQMIAIDMESPVTAMILQIANKCRVE